MSLSSLTSLFSLPQQLLGGAGAGGGAATQQQAAAGGTGGAGALFGGLMSAFKTVAPSILSAIPIVGSFAPLLTAAMPLLGGVMGAVSGGAQAGKPTANQGGAIDSAESAALMQMMAKQKALVQAEVQSGRWATPATSDASMATAMSGYGSRVLAANTTGVAATTAATAAQRGPAIQVDGATQAQVTTVDRTLAAISQDPMGASLMQALAGRNLNVTVLDDATYQALAARGVLGTSPDAIFLSSSMVANPRALTTALVNGLATATQAA